MNTKFGIRFKKIIVLICLSIFTLSFFAGCSFVTKNTERDLSQAVAVVGGEAITKRDLLELYNSESGQYSGTPEEVMNDLFEKIVNIKILAQEAKRRYEGDGGANTANALAEAGQDKDLRGEVIYKSELESCFTVYELNEVRDTINEVYKNQIESHIRNIKAERKIEEDGSETVYPKEYTEWPVRKDPKAKEEKDKYSHTELIRPYGIAVSGIDSLTNSINKEAYKRFEKQLKAIDKTYSSIYRSELENKLVLKFYEREAEIIEERIVDGNPNGNGSEVAEADRINIVDEIKTLYDNTIKNNKEKYTSLSAFESDFNNGNELMLYYPYGGYFYVSHTLIKYSDAQKTQYDDKSRLLSGVAFEDFISLSIKPYMSAFARFEGKEYGNPKNINEITREILDSVNYKTVDGAQVNRSPYERVDAFVDLIYKYNQDEGMFQVPRGYAIFPKERGDNNLDPVFVKGARAAYANMSVGARGGLSDPVFGIYGAHYIMVVDSFSAGQTLKLEDYYGFMGLTVWDILREKIVEDKKAEYFNKIQNEVIKAARDSGSVVEYKSVIDQLFNDKF